MIALEEKLEEGKVTQDYYDKNYPLLKEAQKFFGFSSPRRFWYAIGMPLMVLYFSLLFLSVVNLLPDKSIRKAIRFACTISLFIGLYFTIYVLWPGTDFPESLYYVSLLLMSLMATSMGYFLVNYRLSLTLKIRRLVRFITIEAFGKYVRKEDQEKYLDDSFEVYDDILK